MVHSSTQRAAVFGWVFEPLILCSSCVFFRFRIECFTGIAKLLIGSVASHVVAHAPCSVLVVKRVQDVVHYEWAAGRYTPLTIRSAALTRA